jgi:hypothetical protein
VRDQVVADQSAFSESSMAGLELAAGFGQLVQTSSACLSSSEGSGALAGGERHTRVALCRAVHAERLGPAADAWRRVPHHATAQGRPRARRPRPTNGDRRCSSAAGANTVHLKFSINIRSAPPWNASVAYKITDSSGDTASKNAFGSSVPSTLSMPVTGSNRWSGGFWNGSHGT